MLIYGCSRCGGHDPNCYVCQPVEDPNEGRDWDAEAKDQKLMDDYDDEEETED